MTRRPRAKCPVLTDPGYGRRWDVERFKTAGRLRWGASLMSRTGSLLGYVMEYDNGWGANTFVRGHRKMVAAGRSYGTAQDAADALLKARQP